MNAPLPPAAALPDEIQALLATLRETEDRLHEITAGQVDSLTDAEGRTYVLQRAQEAVRRVDADRRKAILNSVPANIALLDAGGYIVATNEAWRRFGLENGLRGSSADVGANYVDVCHEAHGDHADGATWIGDGLLAVLDRAKPEFHAVYACHSPDVQRWFHMTATPVGSDRASGLVVMHVDISERKSAELSLAASEAEQRQSNAALTMERARLVAAQRVAKVGSWETDLETMALDWSEETYRIHEIPAGQPVTHADFIDRVHPADRARLDAEFLGSVASREPAVTRHRLLLPGGCIKVVEERWQMLSNGTGPATHAVGTCQDITERCLDEDRIERLNRGYLVLSQINALIVRVRNRDELFHEACRIAIDAGGFEFAWIGRVDAATDRIVSMAFAGDGHGFTLPGEGGPSLRDDLRPYAVAVRSRQAVIVNDLLDDDRFAHLRGQVALPAISLVSLPIVVENQVVAVMGLHAADVGYFDGTEIALLTDLANDIAFAIDHLDKTEAIDYLAYFDPLTGLPNRTLLLDRTAQCLRSATGAALVLVDLERFKSINDSLGLHAGDDLLRQVAAWFTAELADPSLLARIGADQFAILLTDSQPPGEVARSLERLVHEFHHHAFQLDGAPFRIAAKFGVATFPDDTQTARGLFTKAESALKNAKAGGRRQQFYTQAMTDSIDRKLRQENQLRHALDNQEFVLHYQPKINVQSGKVVSAEALIRWNDPATGKLIPPVQFIPILEETGLILEVGRWAIQRAIEDYLRWRRAGLPAVRLAVNVSPIQLRDPTFIEDVRKLVSVDPLAPGGLELEITESMIMTDIGQSIAILHALRDMGLRVAIDDFGTGFSSLGYLSRLPVDTLKIDRSFIDAMGDSAKGLSLVSTMISLAHSFDLCVVAEGVETEEQSSLLKLLRCDESQGYLHGRPVPVEEFEANYLR